MGGQVDRKSLDDEKRPFLMPATRVSIAFAIVFGVAAAMYHLMGLDLVGILFYLSIGAFTVVVISLTTRSSIFRHLQARVIQEGELPRLDRIADNLSAQFRVPRPRLMLVLSEEPNALTFGFGRRTYVGVTDGLLRALDDRELTAVIAHEFAHIWNRDSVTLTLGIAVKKTLYALTVLLAIAIVLAGMIIAAIFLSASGSKSKRASGSLMIVPMAMALGMCILSPIAIGAGQCFFSRRGEFRADEYSVRVTGRSEDLAEALMRIDGYPSQGLAASKHGVYSSLWISGKGETGVLARFLSSHPPMAERIRRLMEMSQTRSKSSSPPLRPRQENAQGPKRAAAPPRFRRIAIPDDFAPQHEPRIAQDDASSKPATTARYRRGNDEYAWSGPPPRIIDGIVTYEVADKHTYSNR